MVYHQQQLDATFGALADRTRRTILSRLAHGDLTISELASRFDMSLPAVSKHVRVLEHAGLASITREGRVRRATLIAAPMRAAAEWIEEYRRFWEHQLDLLATYLETATDSETESWPTPPPKRAPKRARSKSGARSTRRANASSRRSRNRKN